MTVVQIVKKRINLGFYGNPMNTVQCIGQPIYIYIYIYICCIIPYIASVKIVRNQNFFFPRHRNARHVHIILWRKTQDFVSTISRVARPRRERGGRCKRHTAAAESARASAICRGPNSRLVPLGNKWDCVRLWSTPHHLPVRTYIYIII